MPKTLNLAQKHKLTKKEKPFTLKEGKMYKMGQNNRLHKCLIISRVHSVFKELREGVAR
jgi:hypothetical protein